MTVLNERPHKKLEAWKKSIALVTLIYEETKIFPQDEEYGLKSQLRRAAVSVPSNIAEGLTRKTKKDKLHFLNIAQGSLSEIDTQVEICLNMKYFDETHYERIEVQLIEIQKLLSGLSRVIRE
jgi:four helix bundle protein